MIFLKLRRSSGRKRRDGTQIVTPVIVDAPRKYAHHSERVETNLSTKSCHLITGPHDSGKSRMLIRMRDDWAGIWGAKIKHPPIYLSALSPISVWTDLDHVVAWHKKDSPDQPWAKLKQQQKVDRLVDYVADTKAVVIVDDAHKLTGRKLQIARNCIISSKIWLISSIAENRLAPNLRTIVERRQPQRTSLASDASYDATSVVVWSLVFFTILIGWWQAGIVLGGMKALGSGRRSSRED